MTESEKDEEIATASQTRRSVGQPARRMSAPSTTTTTPRLPQAGWPKRSKLSQAPRGRARQDLRLFSAHLGYSSGSLIV
jgi:hypothetical protein